MRVTSQGAPVNGVQFAAGVYVTVVGEGVVGSPETTLQVTDADTPETLLMVTTVRWLPPALTVILVGGVGTEKTNGFTVTTIFPVWFIEPAVPVIGIV